MPVVTIPDEVVLPERDKTDYALNLEREPTMQELVSAYKEDSLLNSLAVRLSHTVPEADPDYDPQTDLAGYENYAQNFIGSESAEQTQWIKNRIDTELNAKADMAAGGLAGVAVGLTVGAAYDPTMLIPIGGVAYKSYRTGARIMEGAAKTALATGTVVAGSELALQSLQETRTAEESLYNVAGATFLGGVIGGAAGAFGSKKALIDLGERVDKELNVDNSLMDVARPDGSVGAMAVNRTTLKDEELKSALGLEKLLSFQDPILRMANSPSKVMRQLNESLAESPLVRNKNSKGIASPISVENRVKGYDATKFEYYNEKDRLFLQYRQSKSKLAIKASDVAQTSFGRARKDGMLTEHEFGEQITHALRNNDEHEIPEVAAAAKAKRKYILDPLFNEAKAVGLIDEDVTAPTTAMSYVNRVYDKPAIEKDRRRFQDVNTQWLKTKRDRASAEVEKRFADFDLENGPIKEIFQQEKAAFRSAKQEVKNAAAKEAKAGDKVEKVRITIDQFEARLNDATKNQQRIYNKILNGRERGDADMQDLFFEFRSVTASKRDLYKSLMAKESDAEIKTKDYWRREQITNALEASERRMEERINALEKQLKEIETLQYKASFDDLELDNVAYQLVDRILGTPAGRLSYDNKLKTGAASGSAGKRGPAKARVYDIPDEMIKDFLINDDHVLTESYVRSLASDIELMRTFGTIDPEDALKKIQDDYAQLENGISDAATLKKLRDAKLADIRDFQAVWERIRGTYGTTGTDDYASGFRAAERTIMNMNYVSLLGGMTISAFTDVGRPVMVHGLKRVMGDGIAAMATDFKGFKAAAREVQEAGTALDMALNTRARSLFGVDEFTPFANKAEAVTGAMANNFGIVSLMAPWNSAAKQFVGVLTQSRILRLAKRIVDGEELPVAETEFLAQNFIDKRAARNIYEQFTKHGEEHEKVLIPNARNWDNAYAQEVFRAAIRRDVDRTIITPGQDKPLLMSRSGWKLLTQFRSFAFASTQRTMIAGLQQRDAAVLNGVALSVALGSLVYVTKTQMSGREPNYEVDNLLAEGVDKSGVMGWLMDVNAVTEKVSRGRIGVRALTGGQPMSRYASRSALEAVFGPTYGMAGNVVQAAGSAFSGEWQATDTKAIRRLMPYQNLFYIRSIMDDAERNINDVLGVPNK